MGIRQRSVEDMGVDLLMGLSSFYAGKRVFLTGHTGFKGAWLCLWLHALGAKITGYALKPPTAPNLFELCNIPELITSVIGDVRDFESLLSAMRETSPEIVFHLAAQPIVRASYSDPVETYTVNVMGTVNLLEAVRHVPGVKAVVNVTTDKCYENQEWLWGYREHEPLGGHDPYSSSKACSELITAAYRRSFFSHPPMHPITGSPCQSTLAQLATARAGNVIGGGDWAKDRLIPDCIRSMLKNEKLMIRNPSAIRPWQHVLEPLAGYLLLAMRLHEEGSPYAAAWNFGPCDQDCRPVRWIVERISGFFNDFVWECESASHAHEANILKLDSSKACSRLGWQPRWRLETALYKTVEWYQAMLDGMDMRPVTLDQIRGYTQQLEPKGGRQ